MTRLDFGGPVRKIKVSRRCLTGRVAVGEGTVSFESSLERDWIVLLDFDPRVQAIKEQPFFIHYQDAEGQRRRYTPDVLAVFGSATVTTETVVYEVKPREDLRAEWQQYKDRFRAMMRHCRHEGWRFRVVTEREIRTQLLLNAKFLRRYRDLDCDTVVCAQLLFSLKALGETTPQALLAAAYWTTESRMSALPMLWRLIATREIAADLNRPLTMSSSIWLKE